MIIHDWKPDGDYDWNWPELSDGAVRGLKPDTVAKRLDGACWALRQDNDDPEGLVPTFNVGGADMDGTLESVIENHLLLLLACLEWETGWPHEIGWPTMDAVVGNVAPFGSVAARRLRDRGLVEQSHMVDDDHRPCGSGYFPTREGYREGDRLAALLNHDLDNDEPEGVYRYASWKLDRAVMETMALVWDQLHFMGVCGCSRCTGRWTGPELAHAEPRLGHGDYATAALKALVARGVASRRPVVQCGFGGPPRMHTYCLGGADYRDAKPKLITLGKKRNVTLENPMGDPT